MSARASTERSPIACSGAMYKRGAADRHFCRECGGTWVPGQLDEPEVEHLGDVRLAAA